MKLIDSRSSRYIIISTVGTADNGDTKTLYAGRSGDPRGYADMPVWTEYSPEQFEIPRELDLTELKKHVKHLAQHWKYKVYPISQIKYELVDHRVETYESREVLD